LDSKLCKEEKRMRDNRLTWLKNGQFFWKCLKWVLKSALRGKRDIAKKYTIWYTRAGKHTWKNVELENALSERQGLESTLGKR